MPNFVFAYHGGGKPETPEAGEQAMAAWSKWFHDLGDNVVEAGHPVGMSRTVSAGGVAENGGANPLSGLSIVRADNQDAAVELAMGCPILADGGTVEVAEALQM